MEPTNTEKSDSVLETLLTRILSDVSEKYESVKSFLIESYEIIFLLFPRNKEAWAFAFSPHRGWPELISIYFPFLLYALMVCIFWLEKASRSGVEPSSDKGILYFIRALIFAFVPSLLIAFVVSFLWVGMQGSPAKLYKEHLAWQTTKKIGTPEAFLAFTDSYPSGHFRAIATLKNVELTHNVDVQILQSYKRGKSYKLPVEGNIAAMITRSGIRNVSIVVQLDGEFLGASYAKGGSGSGVWHSTGASLKGDLIIKHRQNDKILSSKSLVFETDPVDRFYRSFSNVNSSEIMWSVFSKGWSMQINEFIKNFCENNSRHCSKGTERAHTSRDKDAH